jgi:hypothetical protein
MDYRRAIRGSYNSSFRYPLLYITVIARVFLQTGADRELRNEVKRNVKVVRGKDPATAFALPVQVAPNQAAGSYAAPAGLHPTLLRTMPICVTMVVVRGWFPK